MQQKPFKKQVDRPKKVLQFGEGNFLRAFVNYTIESSNEHGLFNGNVTVVKPISYGSFERFERQDNMYTVILRGIENDKKIQKTHVISCIKDTVDPFTQSDKYHSLMENSDYRFIISNTTEAGIVFAQNDKFEDELPSSFPGKLTKLLYQRYTIFNGASDKGFIFLPVELIDKNGDKLKECVLKYIELWGLGEGFKRWILNDNIFCNTLVDRIVSGYPKHEEQEIWKKLGYKDEIMVTGEPFGFWAIGSERIDEVKAELTLKSSVNIVFAEDIEPYKQRKVRLLNGAHTSLVMGAYLAGKKTVEECMKDEVLREYLNQCMFNEILPYIDLDKNELSDFANSVVERFKNPYLNHQLLDISLNSTSKWRARVLPSILDYVNHNKKLPKNLIFSFASYLAFYMGIEKKPDGYYNKFGKLTYPVRDDEKVLELFAENKNTDTAVFIHEIMSNEDLWGQDLTKIEGFETQVIDHLANIRSQGVKPAMQKLMEG
jgi:tagaturonate reductase